MKKILSVLFILSLFFSFKVYGQYGVQEAIQNLDHNLTTTTQAVQPVQELCEVGVVEELTLQDIDLDEIGKEEGLDLTVREKLSLLGCLIKIKTKEHFKNYGKWYLVGIVGAAGAISAYYYLHPLSVSK